MLYYLGIKGAIIPWYIFSIIGLPIKLKLFCCWEKSWSKDHGFSVTYRYFAQKYAYCRKIFFAKLQNKCRYDRMEVKWRKM